MSSDAHHRRLLDREALEVILGLRRIEGLAHDREGFRRRTRRREADLLHQPGGVGREEHLLGDAGIIDIALDLAPALHLRENPDREGFPRERIEGDAVRIGFDIAEPVGIGAGQHLLDHRHRLVEIIRRRDGLGDLLSVLGLGRKGGRVDDRFEQRRVGVGRGRDEFLRGCEGAAGMALPHFLRQHVDEADAVEHRALVDRIGRKEAVDIVGAQIGDHFRRRHRADLDIGDPDRGRARRRNSAADNCASNSRTAPRTSCPSRISDRACPCASSPA